MKKILTFCVLLLLSNNLEHVSPTYKDLHIYRFLKSNYKISSEQSHKVIYLANKHSKDTFPRKTQILAIMSIESRFKSSAKSSKNAKGLMQILYKKTSGDEENVLAGVDLLVKYNSILKSEKAAIIAYNVGIGNYKKGIRNNKYYVKFNKELELLKSIDM